MSDNVPVPQGFPDVPGPDNGSVPGDARTPHNFCVVGIGASAGGVEAFSDFLKALPADTGMAFVLVLHLDPNHNSILADVLGNRTSMPVLQVQDGTTLQPNHIYVIPPNTTMELSAGALRLSPRVAHEPHNPIDVFLLSLAREMGSDSIGVILSGTAFDGTLGLKAIKSAAGITFCQDVTAKFDSMPRSAIAVGAVDFILPPQQIAAELATIARHPYYGKEEGFVRTEDGVALRQILALLRSQTSVDFTEYKQPTIRRRLTRRMALRKSENPEQYLALLKQEPKELEALFDDFLINVTEFFRDPDVFESLKEHALPSIVTHRKPDEMLRIWVPGCSSGEEVYSIAIVLLEYLDKVGIDCAIRLFGTDLSQRIIEKARAGVYPEGAVSTISPERLKRFFTRIESGYRISRSIRDMCVFSRHNIGKDPPLSRMDLISCRNLLIYLGKSLQNRVLSTFTYALQPSGCLLLGSSETLGSFSDYFKPFDPRRKIYCLNPAVARPTFEMHSGFAVGESFMSPLPPASRRIPGSSEKARIQEYVDQDLIRQAGSSALVVDTEFRVVDSRGDVDRFLSRPLDSGEKSLFSLVNEEMAASLRGALQSARERQVTVRLESVGTRQRGNKIWVTNLAVIPVSPPGAELYFAILFEEISVEDAAKSKGKTPKAVLKPPSTQQHIAELEQKLISTRQYLQAIIEELRSANEEAQSTNEELQSTNEELQTAKEEMQSSNEELNTINAEMQSRNSDLARLNDDLTNLLSSMNMPVLMISSDLRIRRFTPKAEIVLHLIPSDVGRPISDLQPRINVPDLDRVLHQVLESLSPYEQEVQDQEGNWHLLRVRPYRTSENRIDGAVIQLLDISELKRSLESARDARDYAQAIVDTVRAPLVILDDSLRMCDANRSFYDYFRTSPAALEGSRISDVGRLPFDHPGLVQLLQTLITTEASAQEIEFDAVIEGSGTRVLQVNARRIPSDGKRTRLMLLAFEDVTDRKRAAEARYRRLFETSSDGIVIVDAASGDIADVNPFIEQLLGYKRDELVGKKFWDVAALARFPQRREALDRIREQGLVRFPDVMLTSRAGRDLQLEAVGNIYTEGVGTRRVIQLNLRDLTERRKFERELQHTARLESLGVLAGGIAHDFNNLLTGILGNAGLIYSELPVGDRKRAYVRDITHAAERAAHLTRQMLAYSGRGRFINEHIHVFDFIRDSMPLIQTSIPKSVEVVLKLDDNTPDVEADTGQLQQVFMNLVINGAEAIGEQRAGSVEIRTCGVTLSREEAEENYPSDQLVPGLYLVIEVQDNGSGMDDATKARIFDPFFTTKFTGRGLGLAAVQGIVHGHGGTVRVYSTPGEGSLFRVLLPAAPRSEEHPKAPRASQAATRRGTILVIDDEEVVRNVARKTMEREGHSVLMAENGKIGLEIFEKRKDEIGLILLDLLMPVMGGEETLKRIRAINAEVPVILLSGFEQSEVIRRFGEQRFAAFVQKPFTSTALLQVVSAELER